MNISLIAAADMSDGIGKGNDLLLAIPQDLKRFKQLTLDKDIVMGRKTFDSLGRILPQRNHIVLTRDTSLKSDDQNVHYYNHFEDILLDIQHHSDNEEVFVIGGEQVFKLFLPYANKIYLTRINHTFVNVDTYFPYINPDEWQVDRISEAYEHNGYSYRYIDMSRMFPFIKY